MQRGGKEGRKEGAGREGEYGFRRSQNVRRNFSLVGETHVGNKNIQNEDNAHTSRVKDKMNRGRRKYISGKKKRRWW